MSESEPSADRKVNPWLWRVAVALAVIAGAMVAVSPRSDRRVFHVSGDDLTPEMKVTAWWHLGHTQPRNGMTDSERNADRARRAEAFGKAWKVDPEYVSHETISAAVNWGQSGSGGTDGAERRAEVYRWLRTRTDAMLRESVTRPWLVGQGGPPMRVFSSDASAVESRYASVRESLQNHTSMYADNLSRAIQDLAERDPERARRLLELVRDVAPTDRLQVWEKSVQAVE